MPAVMRERGDQPLMALVLLRRAAGWSRRSSTVPSRWYLWERRREVSLPNNGRELHRLAVRLEAEEAVATPLVAVADAEE